MKSLSLDQMSKVKAGYGRRACASLQRRMRRAYFFGNYVMLFFLSMTFNMFCTGSGPGDDVTRPPRPRGGR
ncbi:MAG: hypothetical protein AAFO07_23950 [Bacteroidota bacterium]